MVLKPSKGKQIIKQVGSLPKIKNNIKGTVKTLGSKTRLFSYFWFAYLYNFNKRDLFDFILEYLLFSFLSPKTKSSSTELGVYLKHIIDGCILAFYTDGVEDILQYKRVMSPSLFCTTTPMRGPASYAPKRLVCLCIKIGNYLYRCMVFIFI